MELSQKQKFKLKKFIRKLEKVRGRHTELVSVYIPAGYDINKIINHIAQEQGTAENIKDKTTRQHVINSLERIIRHLRLYTKTPDNGLAVFAGDFSDKDKKTDTQVYSIEPPQTIKTRIYRCDQTFHLDILKEMMEHKETYGLLVIDRREATIGLLKGTQIKNLLQMTSGVPGKTKAGGQCLHPETTINLADGQYIMIQELKKDDEILSYNFKDKKFIQSKVVNIWKKPVKKIYRITTKETLICSRDHIIFLEDGSTKPAEKIKEGDLLINENGISVEVQKVTTEKTQIELIDIEVENKNFIAEGIVVHNSAQRFASLRAGAAKEFYRRISEKMKKEFFEMKNLKGIIIGGPGPTKEEYLREGQLPQQLKDKVIAVEDLGYTGDYGLGELVNKSKDVLAKEAIMEEKQVMEKFFKLLATKPLFVTYGENEVKRALELSAIDTLLISENLDDEISDELEEKGEIQGADVQIISVDTTEGQQLKDLGGIAAILRYPLQD